MPAAAIYTRISKDDHDDGLGVDRQERLCRDLAQKAGLDVAMVLVDNDVSAYRIKKRPGFEQLVDMLKDGAVDAVVVYHADRLYRRTTDLERLVTVVEASGAQVHTVAAGDVDLSSASGRMVARMLGAAAQHESERMSERLKAKMDELAASGKPPGGRPPYGYASGYVIDPREAETVRLIAAKVLEGQSLLSIARDLDSLGHKTREGRPWHHSTVRAAVVNPAVAGLRVHRREVAGPGTWEPVLDRPMWERVRAVLADPARKKRRPVQRYLLTGLLEGCAGDSMIGRPDRGAGGRTDRRTYATRSPAKRALAIDADDLEAIVTEMVLSAFDGSTLPAPASSDNTAGEEVARLESELAELAAVRGEGTISMAEWLAVRKPLQERLDAAKVAARHTSRPSAVSRLLGQPGAVRKAWPMLEFSERRAVIEATIEKVVIGPATRARHTPIEERLDPAQGFGVIWRA
jgi:DNA invertase Pin-like site-specific DNA recombinase